MTPVATTTQNVTNGFDLAGNNVYINRSTQKYCKRTAALNRPACDKLTSGYGEYLSWVDQVSIWLVLVPS